MRPKPTCRKCGHEHYNFQECSAPAAVEQREPRTPVPLTVIENPQARGLRPWGDRLDNYQRMGNNLVLKGEMKRRGGVIEPPEWSDGPEAA